METTPDRHNTWKVDIDYLQEALGEIHRNGSTVITVTPHELIAVGHNMQMKVTTYLIIYYNPPIGVIPPIAGSGDPATLQ
jgi:hypothetical protein